MIQAVQENRGNYGFVIDNKIIANTDKFTINGKGKIIEKDKNKLIISAMSIIYQVTSKSSICLKQATAYEETVTQQWQISYKEKSGAGFFLTKDMLEKPATNLSDMKPSYALFDIINEAMQTIVVSFNRFNQLVMVENQKDIIAAWKKSKQKIIDKFGEEKAVRKVLDETEFNYYNFSVNILERSIPYCMLLASLCEAIEYQMDFRSILNEDDNVKVKVSRSPISMLENGKVHYYLKGSGKLGHLSKLEEKYTQNILPFLPDTAFEYLYQMQTDYTFAGERSLFFERAVTRITEQASQDYVYCNQTIIEQIEPTEKEERCG